MAVGDVCSKYARAVYAASASARDSREPLQGAYARSNSGGGGPAAITNVGPTRLKIGASGLGQLTLDLGDGVVDGNVGERAADLLRRRMRIAGEAVVDARRRVRILTAAATASASTLWLLAAHPRVVRRLPLLRGHAGGIE